MSYCPCLECNPPKERDLCKNRLCASEGILAESRDGYCHWCDEAIAEDAWDAGQEEARFRAKEEP